MTIRYYILVLFIFIGGNVLFAQNHEEHDHHHDHDEHYHRNEIGVALAPIYFVKEKALVFGFHAHYVYNIPKTKFGIGLEYERIFDEHKHNTIGVVGNFRPIDPLSFNISPGVTFKGGEANTLSFALHIETSYEFTIDNIHIGPLLEFAYDPEDIT